ncbi:MAG: aldose 1-epimerase family protein [Isosphaeraceae bacterium]
MHTFTLTDIANDVWVESFAERAEDPGAASASRWSVTKKTLRGGRREGVDLVEVDNGAFSFSVVPTRGMGLWKGRYQGLAVGWESPVKDGPVHPAFLNLMSGGGTGWIEGFDELLARCGLENNGAPYTEGETRYGLHGKIANIPAHFVAIHVDDGPGGLITVEGHVDESALFSTQIRMVTRISTAPNSNRITIRDEFRNLGDLPQDMQILYHWNFGPPFLEEGARFAAPARTVVPRTANAAQAIGHFDIFGAPEPGFVEQVYFHDLIGEPGSGRTLVLLRDRDGRKGVVLRFERSQLPAFTLWKNTGGRKSGYVTGLEPGSNYPNPKPYEKKNQRIVKLAPDGIHVAETTLEVLSTRAEVSQVEGEIQALQAQAVRVIQKEPIEPFVAS